MAKSDPRDFLLNTDYEMDKIVYFTEGELDAGQYGIAISHNLGFAPLIFGVCAFNSDFSDARTIPFTQEMQSNTIQFVARASKNAVNVSYINYDGSPAKIYYRIYGLEPSDSHAEIAATASHARQFILNTDYNYCKLFKKGVVSGATDATVNHNLGYIPQVLTWLEVDGVIEPLERADWGEPANTTSGVAVTDSQIKFNTSLYQYNKIHYRIYYDEA